MSQDQENGGDVPANSEAPSNGKSGNDSARKDVCRDFLNKICNRGTRCKFYHPPSDDSKESRRDDFSFCIDYQNQGCFRQACRFAHAPSQDIENYKKTGDVSSVLARAIAAVTKQDNINGIPFCKEFQSNRCSRGSRCRYWHVNVEAERERRKALSSVGGESDSHGGRYQQLRPQPMSGSRRRPANDSPGDYLPSKRGGYEMSPLGTFAAPQIDAYYAQLERDNAELRRELESARREIQRERDRYDTLLAAINPNIAVHQQQQVQTQSPYGLHAMGQTQMQPQQIQPVPPLHQQQNPQKWADGTPDWLLGGKF